MGADSQSKAVCVGIIMDGNRRWAKKRSLPALAGHEAGYQKLIEVLAWARDAGVRYLIAYAFSTENWNRAEEEVSYLMKLIERGVRERLEQISEEKIRIRFVGDRSRFPERIQEYMRDIEARTKDFTEYNLAIALSYGGRAEIIDAMRRVPDEKIAHLTQEEFSDYLWTTGIPDPDLVIRTGGQRRLSNFLLWQAAYAELYFSDTLWPDFTQGEFKSALKFFGETKRNFGK